MPAMGVALAAIFLGEYPRWFHFAGIALILAGVALSSLRSGTFSRQTRPL
jgi:drug/metabolite transporter (DMT)-like permease